MLTFNLLRGLHILAVIAWMSGLLYLPRLYLYHTRAAIGSDADETFKLMEARLLRMIMNPAMVAVVLLAGALMWWDGARRLGWGFLATPWMVVKLAGGVCLIAWQHYLSMARKAFAAGRRPRSERFWRLTNEAPFILAILMVLAATTKFSA